MNLIFSRREFVEVLQGLSVKKYADTILGLPFLRASIFRRVSVFYFLTIAWATVYVVFKWSAKAPIIAGVNFTNILRAAFLYKSDFQSFSVLFWQKEIGAKAAC